MRLPGPASTQGKCFPCGPVLCTVHVRKLRLGASRRPASARGKAGLTSRRPLLWPQRRELERCTQRGMDKAVSAELEELSSKRRFWFPDGNARVSSPTDTETVGELEKSSR